jgi:hypothetical protein
VEVKTKNNGARYVDLEELVEDELNQIEFRRIYGGLEIYDGINGFPLPGFGRVRVGDHFSIMLIGMITRYTAKVVGFDLKHGAAYPVLKVINDDSWPNLRSGDYILVERVEPLDAKQSETSRLWRFLFAASEVSPAERAFFSILFLIVLLVILVILL